MKVEHGASVRGKVTRTYRAWVNMKQRCLNPPSPTYSRYGGRGIRVCERWMSFEHFLDDMGENPEGLSIDRIDNDGNYEATNCRWADRATQAKNTRRAAMVCIHGHSMADPYLWVDKKGRTHRLCRKCRNASNRRLDSEYWRQYRAKRKAAGRPIA